METQPGDDQEQRLAALRQAFPDLAEAAAIYGVILPLLRKADLRPSPVPMTAEEAKERLERGVPLLSGMSPAFDVSAARDLTIRLARRLEERGVAHATGVRGVLESGRVDLPALFTLIFRGNDAALASIAQDLGSDSVLLFTLVRNTLKPALGAWRRQLTPLIGNGTRWDKGDCFVCGAPAVLAELQGNDQSKHLRCGLCGADWPFSRIRCARCGNEDHATLGILYRDPGLVEARAEVCERCRRYIKVIVTFEPTPPDLLPVEDLATLYLDGVAIRNGYGWEIPHA